VLKQHRDVGSRLSAQVALESGADFSARIANLTANTIFLSTHQHARFREKVRVTLFSVSVDGEVVHASVDPPGFLVAFTAPPHTMRVLEERMHMVGVMWPESHRHFDRQPTLENLIPPSITDRTSDFEEPTNTGSPAIQVPDEDDTGDVLSSPAGLQSSRNAPRLRSTTVVGEHNTEEVVFDEPTEDGYQDRD
jgi:hypothetical protein